MKYLYLIVILLMCSFTSSKVERTGNIPSSEIIKTIKYKNHSYIVYQFAKSSSGGGGSIHGGYGSVGNTAGGYGGAGIVHDPDCSCQKELKELIRNLNKQFTDSIR